MAGYSDYSALGGSVFNILGTAMTNYSNEEQNYYALRQALKRQRIAQEWQSDENVLNRDFQHYERLAAQDWQSAEARAARQWQQEQWEREARFGSAAQVLQRGMAAGLSPSAALGLDSVPAAPAASPSSSVGFGSGSSQGAGIASTPSPIAMQPMRFDLDSIGKLIESLSSSGLKDAQRDEITTMLAERLRGQILDNDGKELFNQATEVKNAILNATKDKQIEEAFKRVDNLFADTLLKKAQGQNVSEDTLNKQLEGVLAGLKIRDDSMRLTALVTLDYYTKYLRGSLGLQSAQTGELNSRSALNSATAELTETQKLFQEFENQIKSREADYDATTFEMRLQTALSYHAKEFFENDLAKTRLRELHRVQTKSELWAKMDAVLQYAKSLFPDLISIVPK